VERFRTTEQATDNNIIRHTRFEFSTANAIETRSLYVIYTAFPGKNIYANEHQCFVIGARTLAVSLDKDRGLQRG
jgi:hypothetical protein